MPPIYILPHYIWCTCKYILPYWIRNKVSCYCYRWWSYHSICYNGGAATASLIADISVWRIGTCWLNHTNGIIFLSVNGTIHSSLCCWESNYDKCAFSIYQWASKLISASLLARFCSCCMYKELSNCTHSGIEFWILNQWTLPWYCNVYWFWWSFEFGDWFFQGGLFWLHTCMFIVIFGFGVAYWLLKGIHSFFITSFLQFANQSPMYSLIQAN